MLKFGGTNKKSSSDSKRHFTVVMNSNEHGLYVSSTPSSAARKAVSKLCADNKNKKVVEPVKPKSEPKPKKEGSPKKEAAPKKANNSTSKSKEKKAAKQ